MSSFDTELDELLERIKRADNYDKKKHIKLFIEKQLGLQEEGYQITTNDIANVHSYASDNGRTLSTHASLEGKTFVIGSKDAQTLCFMKAVYQWMRSKRMTGYMVHFEKE